MEDYGSSDYMFCDDLAGEWILLLCMFDACVHNWSGEN